MTAKIISLHNQSVRSREVVARPISRHEALRRVLAVARANGLGAGAVTEKNIAIVAELNLFPEYGSFGTASNGEPIPSDGSQNHQTATLPSDEARPLTDAEPQSKSLVTEPSHQSPRSIDRADERPHL
jgi:hypothetical protein